MKKALIPLLTIVLLVGLAFIASAWNPYIIGSSSVVTVSTGDFRMITADGDATIYASGLDLSGYIGRRIVVTDSSGNKAIAYGHAGDSAESLGSELLTNGTFDSDLSGWTNDDNHWNQSGGEAAHPDTTSFKMLYQAVSVSEGQLSKLTLDVDWTSGFLRCQFRDSGIATLIPAFFSIYNTPDNGILGSGSYTKYLTVLPDATYYAMARDSANPDHNVFSVDNVSLKIVNALGTTALQLRSTPTGSTRNLASKDAGFDPNDIASVLIY